jgi:hypothetical protein
MPVPCPAEYARHLPPHLAAWLGLALCLGCTTRPEAPAAPPSPQPAPATQPQTVRLAPRPDGGAGPRVRYLDGDRTREPLAALSTPACAAGGPSADAVSARYRLHWLWRLRLDAEGTRGTWEPVPVAPGPRVLTCNHPVPFAELAALDATPVGTYWAVAEVDGQYEQALVYAGPVACNDVMLGPAPRGLVAVCARLPASARACFAPDPEKLAPGLCTQRNGGQPCPAGRPATFVPRRLERARANLGSAQVILRLERAPLPDHDFGVLLRAGPRGEQPIKESYEVLEGLGAGAMQRLVDHLEQDGFFHRAADVTPSYHVDFAGPYLEVMVGFMAEPVAWGPRQRERLRAIADALGGKPGEAVRRFATRADRAAGAARPRQLLGPPPRE